MKGASLVLFFGEMLCDPLHCLVVAAGDVGRRLFQHAFGAYTSRCAAECCGANARAYRASRYTAERCGANARAYRFANNGARANRYRARFRHRFDARFGAAGSNARPGRTGCCVAP